MEFQGLRPTSAAVLVAGLLENDGRRLKESSQKIIIDLLDSVTEDGMASVATTLNEYSVNYDNAKLVWDAINSRLESLHHDIDFIPYRNTMLCMAEINYPNPQIWHTYEVFLKEKESQMCLQSAAMIRNAYLKMLPENKSFIYDLEQYAIKVLYSFGCKKFIKLNHGRGFKMPTLRI